MQLDIEDIINSYKKGESMNSIGIKYGVQATIIRRILIKYNVPLRHDTRNRYSLVVKDGEQLIEWAKAQGRLVTRSELAAKVGTKRLSPSYFVKYPELGQYVKTREQQNIREYSKQLYKWLKKNNIPYKPNDRTQLHVMVTALLLGDYKRIAIQIIKQPKNMSKYDYENFKNLKKERAKETRTKLIFLTEKDFEHLDTLKETLDNIKDKR